MLKSAPEYKYNAEPLPAVPGELQSVWHKVTSKSE